MCVGCLPFERYRAFLDLGRRGVSVRSVRASDHRYHLRPVAEEARAAPSSGKAIRALRRQTL